MKACILLVSVLFVVSISGSDGERCSWDGKVKTRFDDTCKLLAKTCGDKNARVINCDKDVEDGQISAEDWKEQPSCFFDLRKREPKTFSRCQVALWACNKEEFMDMRYKYAYVHEGECGKCNTENVCPWMMKSNKKKKHHSVFKNWFEKAKEAAKKLAKKTKILIKNEGLNVDKVCTFDGEVYENKCEFMKARCDKFTKNKQIIGTAFKKMFKRVRKCTSKLGSIAWDILKMDFMRLKEAS